MALKPINVPPEIYERLERLGMFRDSFGDIIKRLLDYYEAHHPSAEGPRPEQQEVA